MASLQIFRNISIFRMKLENDYGIEYGGYNLDPNLNPTMDLIHDLMDISFIHDFGGFDSGGF